MTDVAPTYGTTCRAYSEGVLNAWKNRDLVRLSDLTIPLVLDQIIGIPGPPNMNWKFGRVVSTTGADTCHFYNSTGDVIRLAISKDVLGKAHATFKVEFEQTAYLVEPDLYIRSLLEARRDNNEPRMLLYSTPEVVAGLKDCVIPDGVLHIRIGAPQNGIRSLEVKAIGTSFLIELDVVIAQLGKQHAVTRIIY